MYSLVLQNEDLLCLRPTSLFCILATVTIFSGHQLWIQQLALCPEFLIALSLSISLPLSTLLSLILKKQAID